MLNSILCPDPQQPRKDVCRGTGHVVISFASGRPAAKSDTLARVVSRIVPRASRVKNA